MIHAPQEQDKNKRNVKNRLRPPWKSQYLDMKRLQKDDKYLRMDKEKLTAVKKVMMKRNCKSIIIEALVVTAIAKLIFRRRKAP